MLKLIMFQQINDLIKQNEILKNDLKKEKFPLGGITYAINYSVDDDYIFRIGATKNLTDRKKIYNTHTIHKHQIFYYVENNNPFQFEKCVKCMLDDYRLYDKKDFFACSPDTIIKAFKICEKNISKFKKCQQTGGVDKNIYYKKYLKYLHKIKTL